MNEGVYGVELDLIEQDYFAPARELLGTEFRHRRVDVKVFGRTAR